MPEASSTATRDIEAASSPSSALVGILTLAAGGLIANLYYAQPLVAAIAPALGIDRNLGGVIVSVTQIGFGLGLFFLVSLADLIENRKLVLTTLGITALALAGAAFSDSATPFFIASFLFGLCSSGAQVLIPFVAHLVPAERRGRTVGNVMAGVLTGIMLARPVALFIAASFGWRAVFGASAVLMLAIGTALLRMMPRYKPAAGLHYGRILTSMVGLFLAIPALRRRALYQAVMFGSFNMFWTAAPLMLAHNLGLSQRTIALFALAGTGGAFAAPFAGRLADRGLIRSTTAAAMIVLGLAFYATRWAEAGAALIALAALAILIDGAAQTNHIVSQRIIFSVAAEIRGRVNAIYMTIMFLGGALGSMLGTMTYHGGGWAATATAGGAAGALMLLLFATELWKPAPPP